MQLSQHWHQCCWLSPCINLNRTIKLTVRHLPTSAVLCCTKQLLFSLCPRSPLGIADIGLYCKAICSSVAVPELLRCSCCCLQSLAAQQAV